MKIPTAKKLFFVLITLSILSVLGLFRDLSFPFITSKVLWLRSMVLFALPIYAYLLLADKTLRPNLKNPLNLAVLAFFIVSLISAFKGINFHRSLWGNYERMGGVWYLGHLVLLYFYLETLAKFSHIKFQQILKLLAILGAMAGFYAVITKLGFPHWPFPDDSLPARTSGFFGNPIFFASFLIFPFTLSAFFTKQAESKNELRFWLVITILNLLGIYLSATRGALLGLLVGFGVGLFAWALLVPDKKYKLYGLGTIAGALLVIVVLLLSSKHFSEGSILRRLTDFGDSNTRARLVQWQAGLKGFSKNLILGVGPENYYVIGNQNFNPAIYQYDRSWFDKPHNYPLEVLLTTGSLGFLTYVAIIFASIYGAWLALKKQILSNLEFAVLLGGITAYQIQNLFVFDTVSASMTFFVFLAFVSFLWQSAKPEILEEGKVKFKEIGEGYKYICIAVAVLSAYVWYVTNFLPYKALAVLNTAVSTGTHDPVVAKKAFEEAVNAEMNLDLNETASKFEEFASDFSLQYLDKKDRPLVIEAVKSAQSALEKAIAKTSNDPILWFKLTNMKSTFKHLTEAPYSPDIEDTARRGVALAPNRVEPRYYVVQALQVKKDFASAIAEQYEIIKIDYHNPFNFWRLALVYRDSGELNKAYDLAKYARRNGYEFRNLAEAQWLARYYSDLNQFLELEKIYLEIIKNGLGNFQTHANLATVYAQMGNVEKARATAQKVLELNPDSKESVDAFLKKLDSGEKF